MVVLKHAVTPIPGRVPFRFPAAEFANRPETLTCSYISQSYFLVPSNSYSHFVWATCQSTDNFLDGLIHQISFLFWCLLL